MFQFLRLLLTSSVLHLLLGRSVARSDKSLLLVFFEHCRREGKRCGNMTRERNNSTNSNSGKQSPAPGASIFVTRKIKHNTLQYYAWKIAHVASLIVEHAIICWNLAKKLFHFLIAGTRVWVFMVARLFGFIIILMPGWYVA